MQKKSLDKAEVVPPDQITMQREIDRDQLTIDVLQQSLHAHPVQDRPTVARDLVMRLAKKAPAMAHAFLVSVDGISCQGLLSFLLVSFPRTNVPQAWIDMVNHVVCHLDVDTLELRDDPPFDFLELAGKWLDVYTLARLLQHLTPGDLATLELPADVCKTVTTSFAQNVHGVSLLRLHASYNLPWLMDVEAILFPQLEDETTVLLPHILEEALRLLVHASLAKIHLTRPRCERLIARASQCHSSFACLSLAFRLFTQSPDFQAHDFANASKLLHERTLLQADKKALDEALAYRFDTLADGPVQLLSSKFNLDVKGNPPKPVYHLLRLCFGDLFPPPGKLADAVRFFALRDRDVLSPAPGQQLYAQDIARWCGVEVDEEHVGTSSFSCPITMSDMHCPVVASDGNTYELEALVRIAGSAPVFLSPFTRAPMDRIVFYNRVVA